MTLRSILTNINPLNIIYPPLCRACSNYIPANKVFCATCEANIKPIVSATIAVTQSYALTIHAIADYQPPLRTLVLKKVFRDRLASRQIAQMMLEKTVIKNLPFDVIIPIPLHWTRYAYRGFNQSYEMAKVLSKNLGIPVLQVLCRTRRTQFQSHFTKDARQENVKQVFGIKRKYRATYQELLHGKRILFVDDLCTTGATLRNAARPLIDAKPQSLSAVVACRVV